MSLGEVIVNISLETTYSDLGSSTNLWGLLLNAGYVTAADRINKNTVKVKIPNNEVMDEFKIVISGIPGMRGTELHDMLACLVKKEMDKFFDIYKKIVVSSTSYMDATENSYHMLFLGMTMYLRDIYEVKGNCESGHGRYDISLRSLHLSRQHIVIEFKQGSEKRLGELSKETLQQIKNREYFTGFKGEVLCIGIAHDKKRCEMAQEVTDI